MDTSAAYSRVADRFHEVQSNIMRIAQQANRHPGEICLVVVSKGHPVEVVQAVIAAGARHLGENYVEEALPKIMGCADLPGVSWHMIGHVQSRKAQMVSEHFSLIHSVDSLRLARRLDWFAQQKGKVVNILLECNVSGEESKYGWLVHTPQQLSAFKNEVGELLKLTSLKVAGLMTIAPEAGDPEITRPYFRNLRQLLDQLRVEFPIDQYPQADWKHLSMGMSNDYRVAIQEGATIVRIGTAILGPRPQASRQQ